MRLKRRIKVLRRWWRVRRATRAAARAATPQKRGCIGIALFWLFIVPWLLGIAALLTVVWVITVGIPAPFNLIGPIGAIISLIVWVGLPMLLISLAKTWNWFGGLILLLILLGILLVVIMSYSLLFYEPGVW